MMDGSNFLCTLFVAQPVDLQLLSMEASVMSTNTNEVGEDLLCGCRLSVAVVQYVQFCCRLRPAVLAGCWLGLL
jgi:hypothetical protein